MPVIGAVSRRQTSAARRGGCPGLRHINLRDSPHTGGPAAMRALPQAWDLHQSWSSDGSLMAYTTEGLLISAEPS